MNNIIHIVLVSVGSIAALFILTKFMGYRQMSQLSMFDYINGITIGSIAAEMSTSLDDDFIRPLISMIIYAIAGILLSRFSEMSIWARRIIVGCPRILFNNGKLYYSNLKTSRLDVGEFLTQCRIAGYFDLNQLQTIVMEPNGHLSFLPKSQNRPVTASDLAMNIVPETIAATIIIDGCIMHQNLESTGHDEKWLINELKKLGITTPKHVFLATCDGSANIHVYIKNTEKPANCLI